MIDLHNHILPALDDGATDLEESLEMARVFVGEGVSMIAATPHLDPLNGRGTSAAGVRSALETLRLALDRAGIPLSVAVGNEIFLTPEVPDLLARGEAASLGDSHYALVEVSLSASQPPLYFEDALFRLQLSGYTPILAHPERYPFVRADPEILDDLTGRDIVLQVTAPSLLGHYGRDVQKTAVGLLRRGAYAVASSDRHKPGQERSLRSLHARISDLTDPDLADLLLKSNPASILADRPIVRPELHPLERRTFFSRVLDL